MQQELTQYGGDVLRTAAGREMDRVYSERIRALEERVERAEERAKEADKKL
jgi:hypothetical protein